MSDSGSGGSTLEQLGIGRLFWLTHEAVIGADLTTQRIVLWNPSAARIFGYAEAEAVGMPLDVLVPPELVAAHHTGIRRFRDTGTRHLVGGPPTEVPAVRKDGQVLTVALTLTSVGEHEERRHVVAVIRDVTAQNEAERGRQELLESMQTFLASASHDLHNPLVVILGLTDLLIDEVSSHDTESRALLERVQGACGHAMRIVDDMHTVATIHAGAVEARPEPVHVTSAATHAAGVIGVDIEIAASDATAWVDPAHVHRMLTNLLHNAHKYGRPPITVSTLRVGPQLEIHVRDAGNGVPAGFVSALFEPFTRAEDTRDRPGTGLGLSIVRGLAEANGGAIRYQVAQPGTGGAHFVVTIPSATNAP